MLLKWSTTGIGGSGTLIGSGVGSGVLLPLQLHPIIYLFSLFIIDSFVVALISLK
jgi:hypothetical protein